MMKIKKLIPRIALGALLLCAGCQTHSLGSRFVRQWTDPPLLPDATLLQMSPHGYTNSTQIVQYVNTGFVGVTTNSISIDASDQAKRARRDEVLNNLIRLSDKRYNAFKTGAFLRDAGFNTTVDLASLGLSAAATVVSTPIAPVLSATDTGIKGAQKTVGQRWLQSQTMIVLIASMDSTRAEAETAILNKMTNTYPNFSIEEGLRLVDQYHQKVSLIEAMAHLQSTMSAEKSTNEGKATSAAAAVKAP
jgi:hypothetical protein